MHAIGKALLLPALAAAGAFLLSSCGREDVSGGGAPRPALTPAWALGHIVWEDEFNTQEAVLRLVDGYQERGIKVDGVIIDSPWTTSYNDFNWDRALYPDPAGLLATLKERGVHSILWLTGCLNTQCGDCPVDRSSNFDEAVAKGYAIDGGATKAWWKGVGTHVDFTNPEAVQWWHTQVDKAMLDGVDGFKVDQGEVGFGDSIATSIGVLTNKEFRHYYYDAMYEYVCSRRPGTGMILARPYSRQGDGNFSSQDKLQLGWTGDFTGEWSSLSDQVEDIYKSALAGYGAVGTEIGGYFGTPPDKEQLVRYSQFGAMTACMINGGGHGPFENHLAWWHGPDAEQAYRRAADLHQGLVPYLFSTLVDAHLKGGTLIVDPDLGQESHMLGPDLFTKAITSAGGRVVFKLPETGTWVDWDTGERIPGGSTLDRTYPLDKFPLFVREGAVVPMWSEDGTLKVLACKGAGKVKRPVHYPTGEGTGYEDITITYDPSKGKASVSDGRPFTLVEI